MQNVKNNLIWGYLKKLEETFRKKKTGLEEIEKKSTLRAFASRAKNVTWLMKAMMKTGKNGKQLSKAQSSL